jgi:hypothetical protein
MGFPWGSKKARRYIMNWETLRNKLLETYKDMEFQGHVTNRNGKWIEEVFVETENDSFYIEVPIINFSEEVDYNDFLYAL